MRFLIWLVCATVFATGCRSKTDDAAKQIPQRSQEEIDQIADQQFASLQQEFEAQLKKLTSDVAAADTEEQKLKLFRERNPEPEYVDQLLVLAGEYPQAKVAVDAALIATSRSKGKQKDRAMELLLEHFVNRLNLDKIVSSLQGEIPSPQIEKWFKKLIANSESDEYKAKAMFGLVTYVNQIPEYRVALSNNPQIVARLPATQIQYINSPRTRKMIDETESLLETIIEKYADVPYQNRTMGKLARRALYEMRFLSIGHEAPEIAGEDLDGEPFKLSDYRGKVVMLDFWGHWCPPCRMMYPHERHIVQKLNGLPFALVGVNSDQDLLTAQEAVQEDNLPWRNFWNGPQGTRGHISTDWNIDAWPTVYLIDAQGIIRHKDLLDTDLDRALEQLMAEMGHEVDLRRGNN